MSSKEEQIEQFDPNGVGRQGSLFGLPFTPETAEVVIIPVPWDVTVSYAAGTAGGPMGVLEASPQIDYFLPDIAEAWKIGIAMEDISTSWAERGAMLRDKVEPYIEALEAGADTAELAKEHAAMLNEVELASEQLRDWLAHQSGKYLDAGKVVGVLGGDHSTPLGLMSALAVRHQEFGILQIDAHADLREAYEGFRYSHASIMTNALELPQVQRLVQVGVRDYCEAEHGKVVNSGGRIVSFHDQALKEEQFAGATWHDQCARIIEALPDKVYVSFDIDGLDPKLCPHTGTPVAGGFELEEALYLIKQVVKSGRKIIGFDLCEVGPGQDEWDGNVGARALYRLACWAGSPS
ncbi:agmatinase family protein [Puniceicoccales bacterium CK1056]|uniref:Agmatinase family protein n=1 Tax=Oceanipulchritudo coccoides TaxID=2706888 RepID=A0A6B2LZJ4_9BACT|nr:agmatinase family protein [Oceanipulchritudo coccoides]NDV61364.1 agmatinase family protein [Oceanipulchritudo coccoides]